MTQEIKHKLCYLGAFLLPIICIKLTSSLFGGDPPVTTAATTTVAAVLPPVVVDPDDELTAAQLAAIQYIDLLESREFDDSPMYSGVGSAPDEPVNPEGDDFVIGAIMAHRQGALALIKGAWYRVGDVIDGSSWKITSIDGASRTVRLVNEDDGRVEDASVPGAKW